MILLRSSVNNAGVNITDFVMESAHHINTGLGAANLVEECSCPPGYEGLSCQVPTISIVIMFKFQSFLRNLFTRTVFEFKLSLLKLGFAISMKEDNKNG